MSRKGWMWTAIIAFGLAVVLAITLMVRAAASPSPRQYVADHYTRAAALDQPGDGRAYTAKAAPVVVGNEIARAVRPRDKRTRGDRVYLQYNKDIVAISPYQGGSLILVDKYSTGARRHHSSLIFFGWSSTSPSGSFRGGGADGGK